MNATHPLPPEATILTREEVATILRCSPSAVTKMAATGRIQAFRSGPKGGSVRFTLADVIAYIDQARKDNRPVVQRIPVNHHAKRRQIHAVTDDEPWAG